MSYNITLIPGDGIGPEVTTAAVKCIEALGVDVNWEIKDAGQTALNKCGELLPADTLNSIGKNKIVLKGPITTPVGKGFRSINVAIRHEFNLFVCLRPLKSYPLAHLPHKDIDLVIMRENTEDLYIGVEFEANSQNADELIKTLNSLSPKKIKAGSALSIKPISYEATKKLCQFSFDYAIKYGRKKLTCVHKANIMKCTDGLFLKTFYEIAQAYSGKVEFNDAIVDNLSMQLVLRPQNFDLLVLPNLYGDIISDLGAGLIGGLGLAAGANIGDDIAVFEPTHGSAPKYTGQNKVNPIATILSAGLMLEHLGENKKAFILEQAIYEVIKEAKALTYDLKACRQDTTAVGTKEITQAIITKIKQLRG